MGSSSERHPSLNLTSFWGFATTLLDVLPSVSDFCYRFSLSAQRPLQKGKQGIVVLVQWLPKACRIPLEQQAGTQDPFQPSSPAIHRTGCAVVCVGSNTHLLFWGTLKNQHKLHRREWGGPQPTLVTWEEQAREDSNRKWKWGWCFGDFN